MAETRFQIYRVSDVELLTAFERIKKDVEPSEGARIQLVLAEGTGALEGGLDEIRKRPALAKVFDAEAAIISQAILFLQGNTRVFVNRKADAGFDECRISYDQADGTLIALAIVATKKHLKAFDRTETLVRLLGEDLSNHYAKREQSVLRLEELTQSLIEQNIAYRQRLDEDVAALKARLQSEAEAQSSKLRDDYQAKEADLEAKETALEERSRALDDRSSRHARREILKEMKKMLQDRTKDFSLTQRTERKRRPIHVLFWLLIATPGVLFVWSIYDAIRAGGSWTGSPTDWMHLLRLTLAAAVIFYIRWNDQWFRQHAEEEFRLKRLDLDINRASWLVEMALEWKDEEGQTIPAELIGPLARNLFAVDGGLEGVRHPAQDLASKLLEASSSLNVSIPGVGEAKLDGKAVKRFNQATREAAKDS
jgi:hypothetical protein